MNSYSYVVEILVIALFLDSGEFNSLFFHVRPIDLALVERIKGCTLYRRINPLQIPLTDTKAQQFVIISDKKFWWSLIIIIGGQG